MSSSDASKTLMRNHEISPGSWIIPLLPSRIATPRRGKCSAVQAAGPCSRHPTPDKSRKPFTSSSQNDPPAISHFFRQDKTPQPPTPPRSPTSPNDIQIHILRPTSTKIAANRNNTIHTKILYHQHAQNDRQRY